MHMHKHQYLRKDECRADQTGMHGHYRPGAAGGLFPLWPVAVMVAAALVWWLL